MMDTGRYMTENKNKIQLNKIIRASVDALFRDNAGQISRDPRKNCLKTQWERLPRLSKQTRSHSRAGIQLSTCRKALYAPPVLCARIRSHAISRIRVIIIIIILIFFSKPAISMLERVDRLISFMKRLQSRWRCARSQSDHFFLFPRVYGRSWSSP